MGLTLLMQEWKWYHAQKHMYGVGLQNSPNNVYQDKKNEHTNWVEKIAQ